jgi:Matrixin
VLQQLSGFNQAWDFSDSSPVSGFNLSFHQATTGEYLKLTLDDILDSPLIGSEVHPSAVTINLNAPPDTAVDRFGNAVMGNNDLGDTEPNMATIWLRSNYTPDVLVHEFGHALGLTDSEDPLSIMFYAKQPLIVPPHLRLMKKKH